MALKSFTSTPSMIHQIEHNSDEELIRAKLVSETAKIAWSELQRFFAEAEELMKPDQQD